MRAATCPRSAASPALTWPQRPANWHPVHASGSRSGLGWSLKLFLLLVLVLLAWGLEPWSGTPGFDETLDQVLDGDLDQEDRLDALKLLRDLGLDGVEGDDGALLVAAMAAVLLGDGRTYDRAAERLPPLLVDVSVSEADLDRASLGEPSLRSLLAGLMAESEGDAEEARRLYTQAELSARLWKLPLAEWLAAEALLRLR